MPATTDRAREEIINVHLARLGTDLPELMTAGGWVQPAMPARYVARELAGRSAVAKLYERKA